MIGLNQSEHRPGSKLGKWLGPMQDDVTCVRVPTWKAC